MAEQQAGVTLSVEQFQELMASMAKTIGEEIRKPTPEEQAKRDEEAALKQRRIGEMMEVARAEEAATEQRQKSCNHTKPNGQPCVSGQTFSDGVTREFCLRCQKLMREYKMGNEVLAQGFGNVTEQFATTAN